MAPAGDIHSSSQTQLILEIGLQGQRQGHGLTRTEPGVVLRRNPDRFVVPDVAFITNASLPLQLTSEGYLLTIPELVVEVRSPNDTQPEIDRKVQEYLDAGVVVVWAPDPARQTVTEYRRGIPPKTYHTTDVLTVPDVIPGFHAIVANLF